MAMLSAVLVAACASFVFANPDSAAVVADSQNLGGNSVQDLGSDEVRTEKSLLDLGDSKIHLDRTPAADAPEGIETVDSHNSGSKPLQRKSLMRREPKRERNNERLSDIPGDKTQQSPKSVNFPREDEEPLEEDAALDELEALFDMVSSSTVRKAPVADVRRRAVDCKWSEWEKKGRCKATPMGSCGVPGEQEYEREKIPAQHGGQDCVGKDEKSEEGCMLATCPPTPGPTAAATAAPTTTMAQGSRLYIGLASFIGLFTVVLYNPY